MEYYSGSQDAFSMRANNPEVARILGKVVSDGLEDLTIQEDMIFSGFVQSVYTRSQGAYRLWAMGVLPDAEWESEKQTFCPSEDDAPQIKSTMQTIWNRFKSSLLPSFVEAIEVACGFNESH